MVTKLSVPTHIRGSNISEIVRELKNLHEQLCKIEQDEFESMRDELGQIAMRLVETELLKHNDKTIKLLVSCCLVNILRLFAPDAPYNPRQLRDIFALIIQQLRALADEKNVYQNYLFYLVESLATVKSIVLLLDVDDAKGDKERLLHQLFDLIFGLSPIPSISRTVKLYLLELLQTLIDESDLIPTELIQSILLKCGDVRQETRIFTTDLVRLCADKLQPGLGLYFNEQVIQYSSSDGKDDNRRLQVLKQLHKQIIDVGRVAPEAVSSVIAQWEEELQADDADLRMLAISSIPQLITAPGQDITKLYPNLWMVWLNKMNDKFPAVRVQWIKSAINMLSEASVVILHQLQTALAEKLQDIDAKVREKTLTLLKRSIEDGRNPNLFGSDICEEIGNRCRDKNEDVRLHAIELLCLIINRLFGHDGVSSLLALCINALFRLIYTNDRDLRLFYEYYIEHALIIARDDVTMVDHARLITTLYSLLNEESRKAFKKWLNDKALFVRYFDAYMRLITTKTDDPRLVPLIQHLSSLFRAPLDAQVCLKAMPESIFSEKAIIESFVSITQPTTTTDKQRKLVKWICEKPFERQDARVKSYIIVYLVRRASLLSINSELITSILSLSSNKDIGEVAQKLVGELIAEFPSLGVQHSGILDEAICKNEEGHLEHLKSYASLITACADKINPSPTLLRTLWHLVENGDRQQVKLSLRILMSLSEKQRLIDIAHISLNNLRTMELPASIRDWEILCELVKDSHSLVWNVGEVQELAQKLVNILTLDPPSRRLSSLRLDDFSDNEIATVLAIKCLRNRILNLRTIDRNEELTHLRILAPLLVEWLVKTTSPIVKYSITKILISLVPRPTATTLIENLQPILVVWINSSPLIRERLISFVIRKYHLGIVGLIFLALPVITNMDRDYGSLKDTFVNLRKNDRFVDPILPLDDNTITINSRGLHRYEDWVIITLIVSSLHSSFEQLNERLIEQYTNLVEFLTDVTVSQVNVSYLFDAAVQLKRFSFIGQHADRNKHLYVLSELMQTTLRSRAIAHKWMLEAVKKPITITDDLLQEIPNIEEIGKNMQRSYLVRVAKHQQKNDVSSLPQKKEVSELEGDDDVENTTDIDSNSLSPLNTTPSKKPQLRKSERNKQQSVIGKS